MRTRHHFLLAAACASLLCLGQASATEYPGDYVYADADTDGLMLEAGEFTWLTNTPQSPSDSPVTLLVSLSEQRGYLYRDGERIAVTTVSTGKPGHDTPTGVFPITEKKKVHHSRKYDNAPMPYMQRLTRWGHALHAGNVRPYPASHGCIRLPAEFARQLFSLTRTGDVVVISRDTSALSVARAGVEPQIAMSVGIANPLPAAVRRYVDEDEAGAAPMLETAASP